MRFAGLAFLLLSLSVGCRKNEAPAASTRGTTRLKVGLVTDVAGRGDQSFNDAALRGLELWAAGKRVEGPRLVDVGAKERAESLPPDLKDLPVLDVVPLVLQSKAPEDYEPNLQLIVDQQAALVIGVGFLLENAVEAVAKRNPHVKFLLIDSTLIDAKGQAYQLPNVRTVLFREEEGSFLAGALAGLVTKTGKVGFVGGMEVPLIKRFESGFRAGVLSTNQAAAQALLLSYTGSFTNVGAGKQIATDFLSKGADVVYHAAGTSGLGVIQAVKEARAQGKPTFVIGVDSDQAHLAPQAVLTSVLKRVDFAVYDALADLAQDRFTADDQVLGLTEKAVSLADIHLALANKDEVLGKLRNLQQKIVSGDIKVPARTEELATFKVPR